jgi:hypothetical protein
MTLIRSLIPCMALLAAFVHPSRGLAQEGKDPVLATFGNGEAVTEKDLNAYVARRVDLKGASGNATGKLAIVKEMALTRALNLEGAALGIERRTEKGNSRFDDMYALSVFKNISPACEAPKDEAAARSFYDQTPKAFTVPTSIRLSRLILPVGTLVDGEPAEPWLLKQAKAMSEGRQKFDAAASKAEQIYKLDAQGDVGWVALNDDNVILRALGAANPGEIVGPVKDGDYVYLFQIADKRPGQVMPWAAVSSIAAQQAVNYCREQGRTAVHERVLKKYGVQINEAAVRDMFNKK